MSVASGVGDVDHPDDDPDQRDEHRLPASMFGPWSLPGWSTTAVAPMASAIEPRARNTDPTPIRPGAGAAAWLLRQRSLQLTEQPGVHPPVDLLADPLDEALGHGRVVARAEITMGRRRGPDFIPDAHVPSRRALQVAYAVTLAAARAEGTGATTRFQARDDPRKAGTTIRSG